MKDIKVLGPGCAKCEKLAKNTETAARNLGVEYEIEKVTDVSKFAEFGVMMTPALVVDGEVKVSGKAPSAEEIKKLLS